MEAWSAKQGFSMMMNKIIDGGRVENPASRVDIGAVGMCQQLPSGSSPILNSDDAVPCVTVLSDTIDPVRDVANATNGVGRSAADSWRIAVHESGHVLIHRFFSNEVSVTIVPDDECSGKTWWPAGVDAAALDNCIAGGITGYRNDDINGVFSIVQQSVIAMMGGCAAEMTLLGDAPPKYIGSDVPNASHFAHMVCSTTASVVAFIEHGYQEALALVEQYKTVVAAIAQALIDHPKNTLTNLEIDAVIVPALVAQAAADEHKRRADWASVIANAAEFSAGLESSQPDNRNSIPQVLLRISMPHRSKKNTSAKVRQRTDAIPSLRNNKLGVASEYAAMTVFQPELIELMRAVLDDATATLPEAKRTSSMKAEIASHILASAAKGVRDPIALKATALSAAVECTHYSHDISAARRAV
jgi:hypothetical protein